MVPPRVKLVHTPYCSHYDLVPVGSHQAIYQVEYQQYGFVPESVLLRGEGAPTPTADSTRVQDDALRWNLPNEDGALQLQLPTAEEQGESVGPSLAGSLQDSLQGATDNQDRAGSRGSLASFLPQHDYLIGQVECVRLTAACRIRQPSTALPPETPSSPHKLFAGHITFEVTAPQLRWIVFTLTGGVLCGKIEPRGPGCYVIFLQSEEDVEAVMHLHRRVLFDYGCLWFARNPAQEQILQSYAVSFPQRPSRLPKGLMIVEEEVSGSRKRRRRPKKSGGQVETQHQPVPNSGETDSPLES
jgi:hypothetical protein